jgi:hypothetical protein
MKNKDLIKKLQELDPEADVVLNVWEEYNFLKILNIDVIGSCVGRGDSLADSHDISEDVKIILLSDGHR